MITRITPAPHATALPRPSIEDRVAAALRSFARAERWALGPVADPARRRSIEDRLGRRAR